LQLPKDHYWGEFVRREDPFWNGIRSLLVAFIAFGPEFTPQFIGTGFVIGADNQGMLLVLTAKHVIEEGAIEVQGRPFDRHPTAPAILFERDKPQIGPKSLRAVWMGSDSADVPFVRCVTYADNLDVALCVLELQQDRKCDVSKHVPSIVLDTNLPRVGEPIHIVSLAGLKIVGSSPNKDGAGTWGFSTRPTIRIGTVRSHEVKSMGNDGPCFTTTIPVDGGMSGGLAYVPRDGQAIAACGIISAGPKEDEGQVNFSISGCSTIVGILGALGLKVPISTSPTFAMLYDLVKSGEIADVAGPVEGLVLEKLGQGDAYRIIRLAS
jgi:hypothetical protein